MTGESMSNLMGSLAKEHGMVIRQDDPILMLHTVNAHLLEENRKILDKQFEQCRQNMELMMSRWHTESKESAGRILNASLNAAQKTMRDEMQNGARLVINDFKTVVHELVNDALRKTQRAENIAKWNIAASALIFLSGCVFTMCLFFK